MIICNKHLRYPSNISLTASLMCFIPLGYQLGINPSSQLLYHLISQILTIVLVVLEASKLLIGVLKGVTVEKSSDKIMTSEMTYCHIEANDCVSILTPTTREKMNDQT